MNTEVIEEPILGTCSFLNMSGDIVIVWNEQNREKVLTLIRKKMAEGYTFFTTKKYMFKKLTRKVKITEKNIDVTEEIIITDAQFDKMVEDMNDKDLATLVRADAAKLGKRTDRSELAGLKCATKAEDVIDKNSVAIRPVVGG